MAAIAAFLLFEGCATAPRYTRETSGRAAMRSRHGTAKVRRGISMVGVASYYGPGFHGKTTANGERFNMHAMTAAHKELPFGTKVLVENLGNGETVVVRINDRGPYKRGRIIDLSRGAAQKIGMIATGTARVRITIVK